MDPFTGEFTLPRLERVLAGPGRVSALPAELDRYGSGRTLVVTGTTLGASPLAERVAGLLGGRCVRVEACVRQHVPSGAVDALVAAVRESAADSIVILGGGSAIDTAKAAAYRLLGSHAGPVDRAAADLPVLVALPTTLSAGEFTDVAGVTDEATLVKHAVSDPRIAVRIVIADPQLTLATPEWLWAASGVRALDHAIESLYSQKHHRISDPLAVRAIETLRVHLPPSLAGGEARLAHRGECQMASWLAVFGVTNAGFGLSHVLGHQIGPRWNVPHGVTSSIVLPHAMRFMARVAPDRFGPIAGALGIPFGAADAVPAALACADAVAAFIGGLRLPTRLRDFSVPRDEMHGIAAHVCDVMVREHAVDLPVSSADIGAVLNAAY